MSYPSIMLQSPILASGRLPSNPLDHLVETMEKEGTISLSQGGRTACHLPEITEIRQELPSGKTVADGVFRVDTAPWIDDAGSLLQTSGGKRNICGDDDIPGSDVLNDPIVCFCTLVINDY